MIPPWHCGVMALGTQRRSYSCEWLSKNIHVYGMHEVEKYLVSDKCRALEE